MNKLFFGFFDGSFVERPEDEAENDANDDWFNNVIVDSIDELCVLENFAGNKVDQREDNERRSDRREDLNNKVFNAAFFDILHKIILAKKW